jgi:hypothetical protein
MYIKQFLLDAICNNKSDEKVFINKILETKTNYLLVNGEDKNIQHFLSSQSIPQLHAFVGSHNILAIDEAQKIPNIGANLKLLTDSLPNLQIYATGSSSFELANQVGEPLVGRKKTFLVFPLAQMELQQTENLADTRALLETRLVYGSYPKAVLLNDNQQKKDYLTELTNAYLYKDILELDGIRKAKKISQLIQLIAFQIGHEVSLHEIGQQLGLSKETVERYLDLLEKCFVLFNINGFSRNLRNTITKKSRYFFYDLGVRNAIINQFAPLTLRNDLGQLWENYVIIERIKKQSYSNIRSTNYFLRTYTQQEIDWIEERDNNLFAYEIKWQEPSRKLKPPSEWQRNYPDAQFSVIHQNNYLDFII